MNESRTNESRTNEFRIRTAQNWRGGGDPRRTRASLGPLTHAVALDSRYSAFQVESGVHVSDELWAECEDCQRWYYPSQSPQLREPIDPCPVCLGPPARIVARDDRPDSPPPLIGAEPSLASEEAI